MRRADRLFRIIQLLRRRKLTTARQLADELEVSERTVYRDVADLVTSGVPIRGEAGVGYALDRGFDLPPLMFTEDELEALVLGARVVESWGDATLAKAAREAVQKVEAVLPERLQGRIGKATAVRARLSRAGGVGARARHLRRAIRERRKRAHGVRRSRRGGDGADRAAARAVLLGPQLDGGGVVRAARRASAASASTACRSWN